MDASSENVVPGVADAQYSMGVLYENGFGVEADIKSSKEWYEATANNRSEDADEALGRLG